MKTLLTALLLTLLPAVASGATSVARMPAGTVMTTARSSCPQFTVAANGASLLRSGQYANLFAGIGTAHGAADGTHFNVPLYNGMFLRGVASGSSNDPDRAGRTAAATGGATGDNVGSVQGYQIQSHTHTYPVALNPAPGGLAGLWSDTYTSGGTTDPTGGSETRPRNAYVLYCIWY